MHAGRDRRRCGLVAKLRRSGAEIAFCLGMALSTVAAVLLRVGLGKLSRLEPPEPANRYHRRYAGEPLYGDIKKLGRIRSAGQRVTGTRASQKKTVATASASASPAGTSFTSASTTPPAGLRRGPG
jgi:hypothetical protein